jgi:hypothetical protein
MATQAELIDSLAAHGLRLRGSWVPDASYGLPALPDGSAPGVVCMVGVVGSEFWPHFKASTFCRDGLSNPLDRWSRAIGDELAARHGGVGLYPFDGPPYHPFQRWADRAEPTQPSAMLLRMHPEHGLWHAYRFALALPGPATLRTQQAPANRTAAPHQAAMPGGLGDVCTRCSGQPCLQACPVGAYTGDTFLLQSCADHLHSGQGGDCMACGCLARRACPVAPELRYTPEHAAFHMRAFAAGH